MKYTEDDYIKKCIELDVEYIGHHKDKKKGTIIEFVCNKHADKGVQNTDWSHFKIKKKSCKYCAGRRSTAEAQSLVLNKNIEFISEYLGSEKPIKCKCHKCGNVWINGRPIDLFRRPGGCPVCSNEEKRKKRAKSQTRFEKDIASVNPNITILGKYKNTHTLIKCKYKIDGCEWESYPANLLNLSAGCPRCNSSVGENKIIQFMEHNNISYIREKTFRGCEHNGLLRFDVYDVDNNIAIEFQGEQHYYPVDFSKNNTEKAQEEFEKLKIRDAIKKQYCLQNNIKLVCIPFWERNSVSNYLIANIDEYKEKYLA